MKGARFAKGNETVKVPLLRPLFEDLVECETLFDQAYTPFARRTFVRAGFAFIEGYVYWLRRVLLEKLLTRHQTGGPIEITRIALLDDTVYKPDASGKIVGEAERTPFKNMCAFVVRMACELQGVDPQTQFGDDGWRRLQQALKVRHRITHPKHSVDLSITDDEVYAIREGVRWLYNFSADLANSIAGGIPTDTPDG